MRPSFVTYVEWIKAFLARPKLDLRADETYASHLSRLIGSRVPPLYDVRVLPVNAADFGAPQRRHRVFFVGIKCSLGATLGDLRPTHTLQKLVWDKWVTRSYWKRHGLSSPSASKIPSDEARVLASLQNQMFEPDGDSWMTCRDAFSGLGKPTAEDDGRNHRFQPGARSYAGHTGSPLDQSAKALKAGDRKSVV